MSTEPGPSHSSPTILAVEDEVLIRMHLVDSLREYGFNVIEAADAAEAIDALKTCDAVDLVFTDITLPGELDGFGLVQWIRAQNSSMPIILTSGGHNAALAAERCKGEPFLEKPYDVGVLAQRIFAALKMRGNGTA